MNAIELIAALKGADEETAMELVDRLQCGEIDCSVLPTGKDSAVQQAQVWAQEARTQKGIVDEIGKLVGCSNDWEMVGAVKAALSANGGEAVERPLGAAHNGRVLADRIENNYDFTCDGGNLTQCYEWQELRRFIECLAEYVETHPAPPSVAVPEGWKLVPIEPTDEMVRKSNWSGNGDVSVNEDWARKTVWDRMIYAAPSPDHSGDAGKVVSGNEVKARVVSGARDMLRESGKQFRAIGDIGHAAMCENHADELDRLRTTDDKAEGV